MDEDGFQRVGPRRKAPKPKQKVSVYHEWEAKRRDYWSYVIRKLQHEKVQLRDHGSVVKEYEEPPVEKPEDFNNFNVVQTMTMEEYDGLTPAARKAMFALLEGNYKIRDVLTEQDLASVPTYMISKPSMARFRDLPASERSKWTRLVDVLWYQRKDDGRYHPVPLGPKVALERYAV